MSTYSDYIHQYIITICQFSKINKTYSEKHKVVPSPAPSPLPVSPTHLLSELKTQSYKATEHLPVNELIDDDHVTRLDLLSQGPASCGHDDVCTALFLQGPDVRLVVDFGRHDGVLSAMSEGGDGSGISTIRPGIFNSYKETAKPSSW